jgi:urease alpha subunit
VLSRRFRLGRAGEGNASSERRASLRPALAGWARLPSASTTFVSRLALEAGIRERLGAPAVRSGRGHHGLAHVLHHLAVPDIRVDPRDGTVTLGGRVLAAPPVRSVPLSRRYLLG